MHYLKIVVFGRGHGESILVELEDNQWMVIDCFNNPHSNEPAALTYLKELGLSPKEVIKKIVITHFHQDHITGMAKLIKESADDAKVYMPQALSSKEAVKYYSELDILHGYSRISGIKELADIAKYMERSNRIITRVKQDSNIHNGDDYLISALSPSDYACERSQRTFISELTSLDVDDKSDKKLPLSATKKIHNHFCIVLNILSKKNNSSILLGSDLEISNKSETGWTSALDSNMAPNKNSVQIFKIPHHGSHTGYHPLTWENYIIDDAIAILTTFDTHDLPRDEYIKIYKTHTTKLYATSRPKSKLTDVISQKALKIMKANGQLGSIRNTFSPKNFGYVEALHSENSPLPKLFYDANKL